MSYSIVARLALVFHTPTTAHRWPYLFTLLLSIIFRPALADDRDTASVVRIAGVDYLGDLPTLIADKRDFFGNNNLRVSVSYGESGKRNLQRLRDGEIDFALMALTPLILDYLADTSPGQAEDPVILANLVHSNKMNYVVSGIGRAASDLRDDRVALAMGTRSEVQWWQFAEIHRFDPLSAQLVDMTPAESVRALQQGEVDTAVLWEPWYSRLQFQADGRFQAMAFSDIHTAKWLIVTSRRTASERPALCRSVLKAYHDTIEYIERNHQSVITEYDRFAGLEVLQAKGIKFTPDYDLSLDWSLIAFLQQKFDWAVRAGYTARERSWDVMSLIDSRHLESLLPSAVGIPRPAAEAMTGPSP